MKLDKLFQSLLLTSSLAFLLVTPATAKEVGEEEISKNIPLLSDIEVPVTSARTLAQRPTLNPTQGNIALITVVKANPTEKGVEVILETSLGDKLRVANRSTGNNFIADITGGQLRLPNGDSFTYRSEKPISGITEITVTNIDENTVRVTVVGEKALPTVELFDDDAGLIFAVTETPQTQTPSEQPSAEADEPIELVVTATRTEETLENIPRSVTVITREQIEQQAQLTQNITDILPLLIPGAAPPNSRVGSINLRGREASILIDGVPQNTNNNQTFTAQLAGLDPENIERIEVISGANAIYGGQATGGLINIITRKPSKNKLTSTVEIGANTSLTNSENSFGSNLLYQIAGAEGDFDYIGSFSIVGQGAFYDAVGSRVANNQGYDDTTTINALVNIGVNLSEQQRLQLRFNHSRLSQDTNFTSDESTSEIPGIQKGRLRRIPEGTQIIGYKDGFEFITTNTTLSYSHENLLGSKLQGQLFYRQFSAGGFLPYDNRLFGGTTISDQSGETEQFGGRLQIETPFNQNKTFSLLWGVDYDYQRIFQNASLFDTVEFDASGGRIFRKIDEVTFIPPYTFSDLGLFAQLQTKLGDNFTINGGVRYVNLNANVADYAAFDLYSTEPPRDIQGGSLTADDFLFNFGAIYNITDEVSVFASFSQGFSFPDIGRILRNPPENFVSLSKTDITTPVDVDNYEIGIRGNWNNVQASLSGFYSKSDLGFGVVYNNDGTLRNVRSPQRTYGIEGTLDWQPTKTLRLGSTIGWLEGENDEDEDGKFLALGSGVVNPLKLTAYIEHQTTPGWRNRLQFLYSGNRNRAFLEGVDGKEINEYLTVDYIGSIKIGQGELQLSIRNLFNNYYFPVSSQATAPFYDPLNYAGEGRTFSAAYRISW
ncbi:MAG: TonB-dependent receptor [Scytonematopsis contorta HA4267-MV1]|jgi:iron complex outermembrane receptor protein|nr:TonB-dependent receptor [Scytonematopsis contorta HA4267-MV1]